MYVNATPVPFDDLLTWLHRALGKEIQADLSLPRQFFGAGLISELQRVESLPQDQRAVMLVFASGARIDLDSSEVHAILDSGDGGLELHIQGGAILDLHAYEANQA